MSNNGITYTQNVKSSWFDEEDDVDDETFLKNSRKPPPSTAQPLQGQLAQLKARNEAVESRTLASTERSLAMLRESEQVGVATAQELAAQREQLERSSRNLDAINATLRTTQRNIDGIKSVFASFKNYLTGPKESKDPVAARSIGAAPSEPSPSIPFERNQHVSSYLAGTEEPVLRRPATAQEAIDRNLSSMSDNITNLRGLALNLGDEILEQNDLLDNMQYKADKAGISITKQNQQMNRLLGKK